VGHEDNVMILTNKKSINAGPSYGTGEGVAHSKRWYVALVRISVYDGHSIDASPVEEG